MDFIVLVITKNFEDRAIKRLCSGKNKTRVFSWYIPQDSTRWHPMILTRTSWFFRYISQVWYLDSAAISALPQLASCCRSCIFQQGILDQQAWARDTRFLDGMVQSENYGIAIRKLWMKWNYVQSWNYSWNGTIRKLWTRLLSWRYCPGSFAWYTLWTKFWTGYERSMEGY